ncbi:hypothetical protein N800_08710 [Lysobacter daejeonensis GH1-9]|uniref:Uncharacterized protein n=1 Tax=Lysobacter daejeonensis GH1-9 TaxID=1385517 RepID=A0A0A0EZ89_9GAMM|nr:hypothetical protein [Lysobacter daejeonensis]KGM56271.1 hypothetical protein N800_08710 [Lysobacter daejeonensis GH1-9]
METPNIRLDPSVICRRLAWVAVLLVVINIAMQTYRLAVQKEDVVGLVLMSLDKENNVPALFSTLLLFTASAVLAYIALFERRRGSPDAAKWVVLTGGFALMAVDESLSLHERVIEPLRRLLGQAFGMEQLGIFYFAWVIPGLLLVAALAVFFVPFLFRLPRRTGVMLFVSAAIYLGGALGIELMEGWWREDQGHRNIVYHAMVSLEEGMEMIGVIVLIHTLLDFIATQQGGISMELAATRRASSVASVGPQTRQPGGQVLESGGGE